MQEDDAQRRIAILRGEKPPSPPPRVSDPSLSQHDRKAHADPARSYRKRRRLAGENDTDRDIRFAQEDAEFARAKREELVRAHKNKSDAPLHDINGHINLFPDEDGRKRTEKNAEAEKEAADKQRSYEDQYTMRFSNAAGFRQNIGQNPWYSSSQSNSAAQAAAPSKDVWGNEDPMRREREKARMDSNDPLLAMKKGVRQLRSVETERKKWNEERSRELDALKTVDEARSRRRRRRSLSKDSLENFKLDEYSGKHRNDKERRSHKSHRHGRDETSSRSHRHHSVSRPRSHSHRHHCESHHRRDSRD
ncbi:hypothetical protein BJX68DRAFT_58012 [Aspergillus pseudodeflectus]|uniref:CBF1-interacting co-repressor CIR N-terminal domain-containing protein n=1 Tax=Aspergillus pseudodeflectus TaxID=176178 RepID=A0ABR4KLR5_9EURO